MKDSRSNRWHESREQRRSAANRDPLICRERPASAFRPSGLSHAAHRSLAVPWRLEMGDKPVPGNGGPGEQTRPNRERSSFEGQRRQLYRFVTNRSSFAQLIARPLRGPRSSTCFVPTNASRGAADSVLGPHASISGLSARQRASEDVQSSDGPEIDAIHRPASDVLPPGPSTDQGTGRRVSCDAFVKWKA